MAWLLLGEWWQEATGTGKAIPEVAVDQGFGDGSRGHRRDPEHPMTVLEHGSLRKSTLCRRKTVVLSPHGGKTRAKDAEGRASCERILW